MSEQGADHRETEALEARRLAFSVYVRAEQNVTAARFYENVHFVVGSLAAGFAVLAGGTAFAGETDIAGVAAIVSAVLTAYMTVHRPEERTASHWRAARDFGKLYNDISFALRASDSASAEDDRLRNFVDRAAAIEDTSFPVASRLCRKAEKGVAAGTGWIAPSGREFERWRASLGRSSRWHGRGRASSS